MPNYTNVEWSGDFKGKLPDGQGCLQKEENIATKFKWVGALLPSSRRTEMFERMSVKTMRHVQAVPAQKAQGLVARVYEMVPQDAFTNGSITSHSKVPDLLAGMWTGWREIILVSDPLDRASKEAMSGTLSQVNSCSYCADMLISLVNNNGEHEIASGIFANANDDEQITDPVIRDRCVWIRTVATAGSKAPPKPPFTAEELPRR